MKRSPEHNEKIMFKMYQKTTWQLAMLLSISVMAFQSCAVTSQNTTKPKVKPMSNVKTIQVVNFKLEGITHDDFMDVANDVAPNFANLSDNGFVVLEGPSKITHMK